MESFPEISLKNKMRWCDSPSVLYTHTEWIACTHFVFGEEFYVPYRFPKDLHKNVTWFYHELYPNALWDIVCLGPILSSLSKLLKDMRHCICTKKKLISSNWKLYYRVGCSSPIWSSLSKLLKCARHT